MALLDILECQMEDLIEPVATAAPAQKSKAAGARDAGVGAFRPTRARITEAGR
jgi:hypothetical protein